MISIVYDRLKDISTDKKDYESEDYHAKIYVSIYGLYQHVETTEIPSCIKLHFYL